MSHVTTPETNEHATSCAARSRGTPFSRLRRSKESRHGSVMFSNTVKYGIRLKS
jgi:hypothetical protein